jgi:hypothetical protein
MGSSLKIGHLKWAKILLMCIPLVLWDIPKILGLGLIPLCAHTPLKYTLIKLKWVIFNKHHQGPIGKKDFGQVFGTYQDVMGSNPMSSITFFHLNPLTNPMVPHGSPCLGHIASNNLSIKCHLSIVGWILVTEQSPAARMPLVTTCLFHVNISNVMLMSAFDWTC